MLKLICGVALGLALAGLTGCTKTISTREAEKRIEKTLSSQVGQAVTAKCPGKLEAKKGKTYVCSAVAADGSRTRIRLTMLDDSGKFTFRGAGGTG